MGLYPVHNFCGPDGVGVGVGVGGGGSRLKSLVSGFNWLILGLDVTVGILLGKDVFCRNFILCAVATFWAMSLVGIYPVRASFLSCKKEKSIFSRLNVND